MFHCNHDKNSTDYIKVFGFFGAIYFQVAQDYIHPSSTIMLNIVTRSVLKQCSYVCCFLMYRGIGAFISRGHANLPDFFRARFNNNHFDTSILMGKCGQLLKTWHFFLSCRSIYRHYHHSGSIQDTLFTSPYGVDLLLDSAALCLFTVLSVKGVALFVSDENTLPRFRIGRD